MKELIPITTAVVAGVAVPTCDARELHAFLEVGRDFSNWIKERIAKYGFVEGEDFVVFANSGENPTGGRPAKEYALTLSMGKELAMVENNDRGRQVRRYFIECEKRALAALRAQPQRRQRATARLGGLAGEFRGGMAIAKLAGLTGNQQILAAAKAVRTVTGEDVLELVGSEHLIAETKHRHRNAKQLGALYGESAQAFNRRLVRAGLQFKDVFGDWQATPAGKPYAVLVDTGKKHSNGSTINQLRWLESVVEKLDPPPSQQALA